MTPTSLGLLRSSLPRSWTALSAGEGVWYSVCNIKSVKSVRVQCLVMIAMLVYSASSRECVM